MLLIKPRKVKKVAELPETCRKCPQRKIDKRSWCIHPEAVTWKPCYTVTNNSEKDQGLAQKVNAN
ncbi:MAG: hypothetical protein ABSF44_03655 [Candidatus Bathyarchaeia archaeon]